MSRGVRTVAVAFILAMSGWSTAEAAEPNGPAWAFGHPAGEAALGSVCALSLAAYFLPQRRSGWAPSFPRPRNALYGELSNFTGATIGAAWSMTAGYGLEASYYDNHRVPEGLGRAWRTSLIDAEAVLLSAGMTVTLKRLVGRCRPRAWHARGDGTGECGPEDAEYDGFPSGHTSTVAAVAGSHFVLGLRSSASSTPRWVGFAVAEAFTVATAALRILAGAHSWEDTLGGWAVGHLSGAAVALAHPMEALDASPGDGRETVASAPWSTTVMFSWSGRL